MMSKPTETTVYQNSCSDQRNALAPLCDSPIEGTAFSMHLKSRILDMVILVLQVHFHSRFHPLFKDLGHVFKLLLLFLLWRMQY